MQSSLAKKPASAAEWANFYANWYYSSGVRDVFYKLFARNRIRLFGGTSQCQIPNKRILSRFRGL
ncbi:hypothetical protein [Alteromonas sp. AMM-1]|uniref:hypothetical protein n=1 Tax=Alteromonas sp. AMM-1 TaxID=3394233 RepID=UPI0039A6C7E0